MVFIFDTAIKQSFRFPTSVIDGLFKNQESPEFNESLNKTCKYFFCRQSVVVIHDLTLYGNGDVVVTKDLVKATLVQPSDVRFWVTSGLKLFKENFAKVFDAVIFKSDATYLECRNIGLNCRQLKWMGSKSETVILSKCGICGDNGNVALLEEVVAIFPEMSDLTYTAHSSIGVNTVVQLLVSPIIRRCKNIALYDLDEKFDVVPYTDYIKQNFGVRFVLAFSPSISEAYKKVVEEFVDYLRVVVYGPQRPKILIEIPVEVNGRTYYQQYDTFDDYDDSDADPDFDANISSDDAS